MSEDVRSIVADLRAKATAVTTTGAREPYHERVRALHLACAPDRILVLCMLATAALDESDARR